MDGTDSKRIWDDVLPWRRAKRLELLAKRRDLTPTARDRIAAGVVANIERHVPNLAAHTIGFYWPIKGEIDLRTLIAACLEAGADAALPVVTENGSRLNFGIGRPARRCGSAPGTFPFRRRAMSFAPPRFWFLCSDTTTPVSAWDTARGITTGRWPRSRRSR